MYYRLNHIKEKHYHAAIFKNKMQNKKTKQKIYITHIVYLKFSLQNHESTNSHLGPLNRFFDTASIAMSLNIFLIYKHSCLRK